MSPLVAFLHLSRFFELQIRFWALLIYVSINFLDNFSDTDGQSFIENPLKALKAVQTDRTKLKKFRNHDRVDFEALRIWGQ